MSWIMAFFGDVSRGASPIITHTPSLMMGEVGLETSSKKHYDSRTDSGDVVKDCYKLHKVTYVVTYGVT